MCIFITRSSLRVFSESFSGCGGCGRSDIGVVNLVLFCDIYPWNLGATPSGYCKPCMAEANLLALLNFIFGRTFASIKVIVPLSPEVP